MKKGFTLVELLIVVAILGILAAVGVVSYTGFMGSAKENATKANHKNVVTWMQAEITKCQISSSEIVLVPVTQPCDSQTTGAKFVSWFANHLDSEFKNPYNPDSKSADGSSECSENLGQINLDADGDIISIKTRYKEGNDGCLISTISSAL